MGEFALEGSFPDLTTNEEKLGKKRGEGEGYCDTTGPFVSAVC